MRLPMPLAGLLVAVAAEPLGLRTLLIGVAVAAAVAAVPLVPPLLRPSGASSGGPGEKAAGGA